MKDIRGILFRWEGFEPRIEEVIINDINDYYKYIDCSTFDCVYTECKGKRISVFCDDEGMLKEGNIGMPIGESEELVLFGNLVFVGDVDSIGRTLGLPDEISRSDIADLFGSNIYRVKG